MFEFQSPPGGKGKGQKGKPKSKVRAYDVFAKQRYHDIKQESDRQVSIGELSSRVAQEVRLERYLVYTNYFLYKSNYKLSFFGLLSLLHSFTVAKFTKRRAASL